METRWESKSAHNGNVLTGIHIKLVFDLDWLMGEHLPAENSGNVKGISSPSEIMISTVCLRISYFYENLSSPINLSMYYNKITRFFGGEK